MARRQRADKAELKFVVKTQIDVGKLLGVSTESVKRWCSIGCPGETGRYEVVPAIVQWLRTEGPWKPKKASDEEIDPLLSSDVPTPALERYRTARAKREELAYEKECRTVLPVEEVRESFAGAAGHLRKLGESLAKQFGPAAQKMLNDGLAEYIQIIAKKFGGCERPATVAGDDAPGTDFDRDVAGSPPNEPMGGGGNLDSDRPAAGPVPALESPSQQELVSGTGQREVVADGGGRADSERQDSDGLRPASSVPSV